jgi:hypothetical protein
LKVKGRKRVNEWTSGLPQPIYYVMSYANPVIVSSLGRGSFFILHSQFSILNSPFVPVIARRAFISIENAHPPTNQNLVEVSHVLPLVNPLQGLESLAIIVVSIDIYPLTGKRVLPYPCDDACNKGLQLLVESW